MPDKRHVAQVTAETLPKSDSILWAQSNFGFEFIRVAANTSSSGALNSRTSTNPQAESP
jgi:hypothetical protein